jgi:hypothetical protein
LIQQTSLEAFNIVYADLGDRQREVYDIIRDNFGICNKEIAEKLLLPINCITGRVKELRDLGMVMHDSYKINDNRRVMTWKVR